MQINFETSGGQTFRQVGHDGLKNVPVGSKQEQMEGVLDTSTGKEEGPAMPLFQGYL